MDVAAWRRAKRAELYAAREAMTGQQRHDAVQKIIQGLEVICTERKPQRVGLYWPIRHEPNLLAWARERSGDFGFCLPVVVSRRQPLEYWRWIPGDAVRSGVWGIQIPARRAVATPDLVIAPLVGFDTARYRLGNGGGYFDRTLAALRARPFVIGVGYAASELETIHPQPHDIAMDAIVTEGS
jgi:5,10-methenyltetrahydrofolate synthetase